MGRDDRIDMLRGLALLSMFVAHCAPSPGPLRLLNLSEYTTAPLFALAIGLGAQAADRGWSGLIPALVRAGIRAAVLVVLGLWLETLGAQVDIVLVALALPTVLAPLLVRLPKWSLMILAGALWAGGPTFRASATPAYLDAVTRHDTLGVRLWQVVAVGEHYRLTTLLVFTVVGILLWRRRAGVDAAPARIDRLVAGCAVASLLCAALLMVAEQTGRIHFEPYSGSRPEVAFTVFLVGGFAALWLSLAPRSLSGGPLAAAGSMTLSLYALQIIYLAWFVRVAKPGATDDSWANVAVLSAGALVVAWAWRLLVRTEPWNKGPIEGPTTVVTRIFQ